MTIAPATAKIIIREARKEFAQIQSRVDSYNEMAKDCAKEGFCPQYCIHGTYQWTDYDNICWGCEEGINPETTTYGEVLAQTLEDYRRVAKNLETTSQNLFKAYNLLREVGLEDLSTEVLKKGFNELLGRFAN